MRYVTIQCKTCGKEVTRSLRNYNMMIKKSKHKGTKNRFCSTKCYCEDLAKRTTKTLPCKNCGSPVRRQNSALSKTGLVFCNSSCAASYNNTLKRKTRRSKCEKKLYKLLRKQYPSIKMYPNNKTMLGGLEVDIAIPSLKLAIEWNGIVHFKPIYGQDKLNKVQANDKKKIQLSNNLDINLIVIPDLVSNDSTVYKAFIDICKIIDSLK